MGCWTLFRSAGISTPIHTQINKHAMVVVSIAPIAIPQNSLGVPSHEQGRRTAKQTTSQKRRSPFLPRWSTGNLTRLDRFPAAMIIKTTQTPKKENKSFVWMMFSCSRNLSTCARISSRFWVDVCRPDLQIWIAPRFRRVLNSKWYRVLEIGNFLIFNTPF